MKKILPFFLLFCFVSPIWADEFNFGSSDNVGNRFFQTISYGLDASHFVSHGDEEYSRYKNIEYSKNNLQGQKLEDGLSRDIDFYTESETGHRVGNVDGAFAGVPPEAVINVLYHYKNSTGHDVHIGRIVLAYSQKDTVGREIIDKFLDRELGVEYTDLPFQVVYSGVWRPRGGVLDVYNGIGTVGYGERGVKVIERIKVRNPIEILSSQALKKEGGVQMRVKVRNNGYEDLDDLILSHWTYQETFDLASGAEHELSYFVEWDSNQGVDFGNFRIRNNNVVERCSVEGVNWSGQFSMEGISVFGIRRGDGWSAGLVFGPAQYGFCIRRVPYTMVSERVLLEDGMVEEDTVINGDDVAEEGSDVVVREEILGVSSKDFILPKTSKGSEYILLGGLLLLVVDVFLWYSVIRKRYERKNILTKICSKGCKDSHKRRV